MPFRLRTFGGLSLTGESGPVTGAATQRRKLALLAVLATEGERGVSRDRLLTLFWSESDAEHARHALTQGGEGLRKSVPRVLGVALGPEQGEQAIAADTALSLRRKHGEQRQLAALRGRPGDRTALAGEREPAEGPEPEGHRPADLLLTSGCYSPGNIWPEGTCTRPKKCGLTGTCMRPCRLASGRPDGDKSAGQQSQREAVCFAVRDMRLSSPWHSLGVATKMARRPCGRRRHLGRRRSQPQSVPSPTSATSPEHHPPKVSASTIVGR